MISVTEQLAFTGIANAVMIGAMWANLKGKVDKAAESITTIKSALGLSNGALVDKPAFVRRHEVEALEEQVKEIKEIIYEPRLSEGPKSERAITRFGPSVTGIGGQAR